MRNFEIAPKESRTSWSFGVRGCIGAILSVVICLQSGSATASESLRLKQSSARPNFSRVTLSLGTKTIRVEHAKTALELQYGLMFVETLGPDDGMLFEFEDERLRSFWMKNTLIALSIAFFDKKRRLISIVDMKPAPSMMLRPPSYSSEGPAKYALEMNQGWFEKNKIRTGAILKFVDK